MSDIELLSQLVNEARLDDSPTSDEVLKTFPHARALAREFMNDPDDAAIFTNPHATKDELQKAVARASSRLERGEDYDVFMNPKSTKAEVRAATRSAARAIGGELKTSRREPRSAAKAIVSELKTNRRDLDIYTDPKSTKRELEGALTRAAARLSYAEAKEKAPRFPRSEKPKVEANYRVQTIVASAPAPRNVSVGHAMQYAR